MIYKDKFENINKTIWKSECSYPSLEYGFIRFNLHPGKLNTPKTWSKLVYQDKTFRYGSYNLKFRYNRRPLEAEVWAGWALYSDDHDKINEINFGIETACKKRCNDQTLIFETYKDNKNTEILTQTGVTLFDNKWHIVRLYYASEYIVLYFDDKLMYNLKNKNLIPTEEMELIFGARVVSGKLKSLFYMDVAELGFSEELAKV